MLRALIITYDYPPLASIGALRPHSWYKNFYKSQIYPVVVTRKWSKNITSIKDYSKNDIGEKKIINDDSGKIILVPYSSSLRDKLIVSEKYKIIRKLLTLIEKTTKWVSFYFDEKRFLYYEAEKIIKNEKIDFIIVSGEPFILFRYAFKLSKKYKTPWIADYRDGWSLNHTQKKTTIGKLLTKYELFFEKKYLKSSLAYSSVSLKLVKDLQKNCPEKKGIVHPNGFNHALFKYHLLNSKEKVNKFTITYAGSLYDLQNIPAFLNGFKSFLKNKEVDKDKVMLRFIGINSRPFKYFNEIKILKKNFPDSIEILPLMPYDRVIMKLINSSVLLKFNISRQSEGLIGGKIYDLIASGNPILTVLNEPENKKTNFSEKKYQNFVSNKLEVCSFLYSQYINYLNDKPPTSTNLEKEVYIFSRENNIRIFSNKIKTILCN